MSHVKLVYFNELLYTELTKHSIACTIYMTALMNVTWSWCVHTFRRSSWYRCPVISKSAFKFICCTRQLQWMQTIRRRKTFITSFALRCQNGSSQTCQKTEPLSADAQNNVGIFLRTNDIRSFLCPSCERPHAASATPQHSCQYAVRTTRVACARQNTAPTCDKWTFSILYVFVQ